MKVESITRLVEEFVSVIKKNVEMTTVDKAYVRDQMRGIIIDTFKEVDFPSMIQEEIRTATKKIDIVHSNVIEKDVIQHKIITRTQEAEDVKEHMRELSEELKSLKEIVKNFEYREKVGNAISSATEDLKIKNAIITDVEVTNVKITEEERTIPVYREEIVVEKVPYEIRVPKFREEYIKIKKLVFPDGREAI